jgi:hypothetical protein
MALDWHTIQDALLAWLSTGTGLRVFWADQNAPQIARPYATIKLIGGPVKVASLDEQQDVTNLANSAGQEIEQTIRGQREITASCQVFTDDTVSAAAYTLLGAAVTALSLPSVRDSLSSVGLALIEPGAIQDISALFEAKWQSRAQVDVRFRFVDVAVEKTGYIATVGPVAATWS